MTAHSIGNHDVPGLGRVKDPRRDRVFLRIAPALIQDQRNVI